MGGGIFQLVLWFARLSPLRTIIPSYTAAAASDDIFRICENVCEETPPPNVSTGLPAATLAPVDGHALRGVRRAGGQHRRRRPESQLGRQGARVGRVDDPQGLTWWFATALLVCGG